MDTGVRLASRRCGVQFRSCSRAYRFSLPRNRAALDAFLLPLEIAPYDLAAALRYGEVRADPAKRGRPIGPLDTMIAAHALSLGATLVSNKLREFGRVRDLASENWV